MVVGGLKGIIYRFLKSRLRLVRKVVKKSPMVVGKKIQDDVSG